MNYGPCVDRLLVGNRQIGFSCDSAINFYFCVIVRMNYGPCVDRLLVGDRLAVRRAADGALRFRHLIALAPLCNC
jgi:hypothetical protein